MWVLIDRLGLYLFDATLSTAVLLSLMMLAVLVCRQPARRLFIARVSLCASLLMLPLVAIAPLPRVDLVQVLTRFQAIPLALGEAGIAAKAEELAGAVGDLAGLWPAAQEFHAKHIGNWLIRGLTLLDLAGIGTGFAWLVLGLWGVHWLVRQSHEPGAQTRALYERLQAGGSEILTKTDLRVSRRLRRPAVVGLFQPTILIPASFDSGLHDPDQLRLSLLHEMAHVEQRDHWHGALANLAQMAWFLLPHVWWLRSRLRIDQEFLADRFASSRYGSSSGYAASLLLLAAQRSDAGPVSGPDESVSLEPDKPKAEFRSPLFQRLLMLLHCPHRIETRAPRLWSWGLRIAAIVLSLVAASVYIRWPDAEAIEAWSGNRASASRQAFRVMDFVAEPTFVSPSQRAVPYILPVVLPERFDLKVEVLATPRELSHTRIAGHLLGLPRWQSDGKIRSESATTERESWHQVRLVRDRHDFQLWVDSVALPVTMKPDVTIESLTIEPGPGRPLHFRNLIVEWLMDRFADGEW
jgi:beta-lactamase regulating signal transducer with metallopeptidase domain